MPVLNVYSTLYPLSTRGTQYLFRVDPIWIHTMVSARPLSKQTLLYQTELSLSLLYWLHYRPIPNPTITVAEHLIHESLNTFAHYLINESLYGTHAFPYFSLSGLALYWWWSAACPPRSVFVSSGCILSQWPTVAWPCFCVCIRMWVSPELMVNMSWCRELMVDVN